MTKRPNKTAPGTRVDLAKAAPDDVLASLSYAADYSATLRALLEFRAQCEQRGEDAYELLARVVAHNDAVQRGTLRGKRRGVATVQANAKRRHAEILAQLRELRGKSVAVAMERAARQQKGHSESTIYRARKNISRKT